MPYCYPTPEHFPRRCQESAQCSPCQKFSFPTLCGFIDKSQIITLSDTCQRADRQEFFTSTTAYLAPSSADFALSSACLEGMNGVKRTQQALLQAFALRSELGRSLEVHIAQQELWNPAEHLRRLSTKASRWPEKKYLRTFIISVAAMEELKSPTKVTKQ